MITEDKIEINWEEKLTNTKAYRDLLYALVQEYGNPCRFATELRLQPMEIGILLGKCGCTPYKSKLARLARPFKRAGWSDEEIKNKVRDACFDFSDEDPIVPRSKTVRKLKTIPFGSQESLKPASGLEQMNLIELARELQDSLDRVNKIKSLMESKLQTF
jgi:hypothetical protein